MKQSTTLFLGLLLFYLFQTACNPDCDSLTAGNIQVPQQPYESGSQLLISSTPTNLVQDREFHFRSRSSNSTVILNSSYNELLNAAIVDLPAELSSAADLLINDPDCSGQLIPIGAPSDVVDASFFVDNPLFVSPVPPIIIIPNPPVTVPANVVNAWFSPNNRDYCIWFNPVIIETLPDGTMVEGSALIPSDPDSLTINLGPVNGSAELAAGCNGDVPRANRFYHNNPVSGIVDKEANIIRISIDRTSKGLGIEQYEGQFIAVDGVPEEFRNDGICTPNTDVEPFFMYLTSLTTGRQLILFRHPV